MSPAEAPGPAAWAVGVVLAPLVAAAAGSLHRSGSRGLAFAAALIQPPLVALLARDLLRNGPRRVPLGGWAEPLGIALYVDGLAVCLLAVTAGVGCLVTLHASAAFRGAPAGGPRAPFWPLWMFLWAALNALFLSGDLFNLYVTLELAGLAAVALAALSPGAAAAAAALRYLFMSLAGSLAYLMGVAILYAATGTLSAGVLAGKIPPGPPAAAAFALMSAGLALKTALFPLHAWLPPAHANAPAPVSALLSGLVVKATFYILWRVWFGLFGPAFAAPAAFLPALLGAGAVLWGSVAALRAARLKLLIAYSTVAQIGYLFLCLALGPPAGPAAAGGAALFLIAAHACAKGAAFLAAGNVIVAFGHDRIDDLGGVARQLPVSLFAFATAGVSLIGLPPTGGFIGKWLLVKAAIASGRWELAAVVLAGGLLATGYVFRFFSHAFRTVPPEARCAPACAPVPQRMEWSALALALAAMGLGLGAVPLLDLLAVGAPPGGAGWGGGLP